MLRTTDGVAAPPASQLRSRDVTRTRAILSATKGAVDGSWAASEGVRRSMQANRRCDTGPECALRSELHARGRRFRKDYRIDLDNLRVQVDVAFPRIRVAVFVDGCFWHRCPIHASDPKQNAEFWERKLRKNVERDRLVDTELAAAGWTVVRCWEHEAAEEAAGRVEVAVDRAVAREWLSCV